MLCALFFFFDQQVVNGEDLMCKSRTGSGKTLAFAIPIIEALYRQVKDPGVDVVADMNKRGRICGVR